MRYNITLILYVTTLLPECHFMLVFIFLFFVYFRLFSKQIFKTLLLHVPTVMALYQRNILWMFHSI